MAYVRRLSFLFGFCLTGLLCWPLAGHAGAQPDRLLSDYTHTAWTGLQGAPTDVLKFAQSADGWLWMATPTGLFRFDGTSFERMDEIQGQRLHSSNVLGLLAQRDGSLWVGYRLGGISLFRKGQARLFGPADGLPDGAVMSITEGPDGTVWAATIGGLAALAPGAAQFRAVGADSGLPPGAARQVLFDRAGTQWVSVQGGIYLRRRGEAHFAQAWPYLDLMAMAEAPDGTLWASDGIKHQYRLAAPGQPHDAVARAELNGNGSFFDRDGAMWVLQAHALERRRKPWLGPLAAGQRLDRENGLSGPLPQTFFQDREGSIWIGTSSGLDRLRRNRLRSLPRAAPFDHPAMVAAGDGQVLIGDYAGAVQRYGADGPLRTELSDTLSAAARAPDGTLWLANSRRLVRLGPGPVQQLALPAALRGADVQSMGWENRQRLWVSVARRGLFRVENGRWLRGGGVPELPDAFALILAAKPDGALWAGYSNNRLARIEGAHARLFDARDGLQVGNVLALCADGDQLWVGGEYGVAWFDGSRFVALNGGPAQPFRGVSGIVRSADGDLWLHGADGISRIAAAELGRLRGAPGQVLPFERFNALDGLQGAATQLRPLPSLVQASDQRLWFATASEIATLDPRRILRNPLPPPVQIRYVQAGGQRYAPQPGLTLPAGGGDLQIGFTALSLAMPERVRLRYRLVGIDEDWQEPLNRREAFYTRLPPGIYQFRVMAANEDGLWNEAGAELQLTLPPRFVQTPWFIVLLIVLAAALLWALYRLRVRQLTAHMLGLQQERLAERARIARGLHDTLLQSVQSLIMFFDRQTRDLPDRSEERIRIEQTLELADQLLMESRDYIMDLRSAGALDELDRVLRQYGAVLMHEHFSATVEGRPRRLQAAVRDEILAIAREALFNAARHARATRVELMLDYGAARFIVQIADNGQGLAPALLQTGERPGHWGLVGMRERARAIGAQYDMQAAPAGGTVVRLVLAARHAYLERRGTGLFRRLRRHLFGRRALRLRRASRA